MFCVVLTNRELPDSFAMLAGPLPHGVLVLLRHRLYGETFNRWNIPEWYLCLGNRIVQDRIRKVVGRPLCCSFQEEWPGRMARKNDTKTLTVLSIEEELASLLAISSGKTILVEPLDYNKSKRAKSKSDIRIYRVLNKPRATRSLSRHLLVTKYPPCFI